MKPTINNKHIITIEEKIKALQILKKEFIFSKEPGLCYVVGNSINLYTFQKDYLMDLLLIEKNNRKGAYFGGVHDKSHHKDHFIKYNDPKMNIKFIGFYWKPYVKTYRFKWIDKQLKNLIQTT